MKLARRNIVVITALLLAVEPSDAQWWKARTPSPTPRPRVAPIPRAQPVESPTPVPTPKVLVALPNYDIITSTRLQIFLDNNNFGPGKIDGEMGEFFRKALLAYKAAHGMALTGVVEPVMIEQVPQVYTTYEIRPEDFKLIGPAPTEPSEQAKLKELRYENFLELVAERFHASQAYIQKLNPGMRAEQLQPGNVLTVPNVRPFEIEKLKEEFNKENPAFVNRKIFIDTKERFLIVRDGDKIVCEFPITPGSTSLPAPKGTWKILGSVTLPWFRHDEGMLNYGVRTDDFHNLPPGPNNPVGVLWMGLNKKGIGIHGTNHPETIGRAASHGCIRLANWDAARVKDLVSVGNVVEIF